MSELNKHKIGVTIIIPVYNAQKYLRKCLDSLLNQTYQNYEVLMVNDGSTDRSAEILEEYADNYKDKFKLFHKENGGQSSARNLALPHVSGEYITFLDSDDYYEKHYLEYLYVAAKKNDSDMVISGQKKVDENGKVYLSIDYDIKKYPNCILRRLNFSGKLYKTEYMRKHKMKFAVGKTYEDNPFNFVMIFLAKNLVILPYSGYYQVGHPGSTTTKKIVEERLPYKEIAKAIDYVLKHKDEINDYSIFEFTILSFFTYFIFQANKKHMYLSLEDRKSDTKVIQNLCEYVMRILKKYFPKYWKNEHLGITKNPELQLTQRVGTKVFVILCRLNLLKSFATLYYKL